jgi:hypothetical protein
VDENAASFGQPLGDTEVQGTDGVRFGKGGGLEGAVVQNNVCLASARTNFGLEALGSHGCSDPFDRIGTGCQWQPQSPTGASANLGSAFPRADDFREQEAEALVRSNYPPTAVRLPIDFVEKSWSARPGPLDRGLDDESSIHEFGQVLADCVVVELEVLGKLGDPGESLRVGQVPVDGVSRGVAESASLLLQSRHQ